MMGIDFIDLTYRVEKQYQVRIERSDIDALFIMARSRPNPDFTVGEFVTLIEQTLRLNNRDVEDNIFETIKPLISESLGVDECKITRDAWLVRDLDMS